MAGHVITRYLSSLNQYEVINASLHRLNEDTIIIDVQNKEKLKNILEEKSPDVVINCIGILINDSARKPALAIYINSFLPHYLAQLGIELNYKTIHLSTDCVFSGQKGGYKEDDIKDGKDHYAKTKALGEIINDRDLTFRTSIIGPELKNNGTGLFHWFMQQEHSTKGYSNVYWTGVTTLELAKAIDAAIKQDLSSLYHLVPDIKISKFDLLKIINDVFKKNLKIIQTQYPTSDKSLINTRKDFNYEIPSYEQMIEELYFWMKKGKGYSNYFEF